MNPTEAYMHQEAARFASQIASWTTQVERATTLVHAVQTAANPPHPGSMIRSMRVLWSTHESRARARVERNLDARLAAADVAILPSLQRGLAGHWPILARSVAERIRKEHTAS